MTNMIFAQDIHFPDSIRVFDEVFILAEKNNEHTGVRIVSIDSLIIENKLATDISILLSENSSIFVKSQGRGSLSTASFRGTNASHTKLSWNNVSLNSPMLGMIDLSQIPVAISDNINLYHGAASLSKNANALGGLVELSNKPDWTKGLRARILNSAGSFSSFDNLVEIKMGSQKFQTVSRIYQNYSKNDFEFKNSDIFNGSIEKRQNADYLKRGFSQEFYIRTGLKSTGSVKAWYQQSDRGVPGLSTNQSGLNNNINRQNSEMLVYSADFQRFGEKSKLEISHGANYQQYLYNSSNYINGTGFLKLIDADSKSFSVYNTAVYKYKFSNKTEFSGKINYNYHDAQSIEKIRHQAYDTSRHEGGIITSIHTGFGEKFKTGVLLRQDFYDRKTSPILPMLVAEYFLNTNTSIKTSVARNYSMPGLNDLYFSPGGNPDLLPETGISIDAGLQKIIRKNNWLIQSSVGINYNDIKNWIMWRPTVMGYWTADNIENVIAYGGDCLLSIKYQNDIIDITSSINYAYTRSFNNSTAISENDNSIGKQLPYIPLHSANMFSKIEIKKYYATYQWNFFSERYTSSAAEPGILVSIYPYFMNDIAFGRSFSTSKLFLDLNLRIYNLFNESYRSVLWQPMPGRNYSIQLMIKFR